MSANWKKKPGCDLDRAISELEAHRVTDKSGRVAYRPDGWFDDYKELLGNAFYCSREITSTRKHGFVLAALCDAGRKPPLTRDSVLAALKKLEKAYLSKKPKSFIFCSALTMPYNAALRSARVAGCFFSFRPRPDPRFVIPDPIKRRIDLQTRGAELPKDTTWVRVRTSGRTDFDAGERALDALTLLRSFWNLAINLRRWSSHTGGYRPAVNQILSGPAHTLHKEDGSLATELFWYERQFAPPRFPSRLTKQWQDLEESRHHWQMQLRKCVYRSKLEEALRRYSLALDDPDYEAAYLKLWALLEMLTATKYARSDDTIRRTTFLWKDREHQRIMLECLRQRRNQQVHESTFDGDPERSVFTLKRYVDVLLAFHLNSRFGFTSIDEAAELLDLPKVEATLLRQREIIDEALAWTNEVVK